MIPAFNQLGFLPEGVWDCSLVEFMKRFAIFDKSDRRIMLYEKLKELLNETLSTELIKEVFIDGSYVTGKAEPDDIDLILALDESFNFIELPFWIMNALDESRLRKKYQFDVKVIVYGSLAYQEYLDFFQKVKHSNLRKGIVRLL